MKNESTVQAWKSNIRENMKLVRAGIAKEEREAQEAQILKTLTASDLYQGAKSVLTYISYGSEVDTRGLIRQALRDQKKVYVPCVQGEKLEFYRIDDLNECKKGYRGIPEPERDIVKAFPIDMHYSLEAAQQCLVIVPGLAYDKKCSRLGFGGGYYDRFLSSFHKKMVVAPAFREQIIDRVPTEGTDYAPDLVLTADEAYIRTGNEE